MLRQISKNGFTKNIMNLASLTLFFLVIFFLGSCARKLTFEVSPVVPAATGKVKIKKSKNDNYIIVVNIKNLAPATRLSPPREVYVVWMESRNRRPENLGMIKTSTGLFSSTLKGDMTAASNYKPAGIFITAEDNGRVTYPGSQVVLKTKN